MRSRRAENFAKVLDTFPRSSQPYLENLPLRGGKLSGKVCHDLMGQLNVSMEALMIRLLPLAKLFSMVPVSAFSVGAVVLGGAGVPDGEMSLYLGANMEFEQQVLQMSLHAEQSAVMNAWHKGAGYLKAVATSELPCGHCRQFLTELSGWSDLMVLTSTGKEGEYRRNRLPHILPAAFSPTDLGNENGFLGLAKANPKLRLVHYSDDPVVQAALSAADASYAPYTGNLAGCAVETAEGDLVSGRYMESVAYNPSVSPLISAVLQLNLMLLADKPAAISRVVLVEKTTRICQRGFVAMLMTSWVPGVELEYYGARSEEPA
ncbi:MAG: cytidine deaminase [Thermodesulfobacteriota bacterium]